jgi:IS1 family transposase
MNWLPFPPKTTEVQFDEKWAFVGKKEKHCSNDQPNDSHQGDNWDHVAYDPEHRLVVSVVPGKRTAKNVEKLVGDFKKRMRDRLMNLITSDEYKPYKKAILKAYGRIIKPPRTGKPGRPKGSRRVPVEGLKYATVHKTRRKGRVVKIDLRVVFGNRADVEAAIEASAVSKTINTAFVERHNGTDRNRNARKVRRSYCFSKDWDVHNAMTYFTMYSYNFCWPVRTLRLQDRDDRMVLKDTSDGRGLDRSYLVFARMANLSGCSTNIRHKGNLLEINIRRRNKCFLS